MNTEKTPRWLAIFTVLIMIFLPCLLQAEAPKNVILLIGDGMGPEHIKAAGWFANGKEGSLFMETLPHSGTVATCPAYSIPVDADPDKVPAKVTDSAAAGTAMATGHKVYNSVISVALPGDGAPLPTALTKASQAGKKTGLITTAHLTDATPSAFGAHVKDRHMEKEIANDYLTTSKPNLLLGGAAIEPSAFSSEAVTAAGYLLVTNRAGLQNLTSNEASHALGLFSTKGPMCYEYEYAMKTKNDYDTMPHLSEMAQIAIDILSREPKGFFLMIEGACIDKASHGNQLEKTVYETVEFDKTVKSTMEWAAKRDDTLVIVTADHETGGLKITAGKEKGAMPNVTWARKDHSSADVRIFAFGPGAEKVKGRLDNTDVFRLATGTFDAPAKYTPMREAAPKPEKEEPGKSMD